MGSSQAGKTAIDSRLDMILEDFTARKHFQNWFFKWTQLKVIGIRIRLTVVSFSFVSHWKLKQNAKFCLEMEPKRKRYFLELNLKSVILNIFYVMLRLYTFQKLSHIDLEETFILVFVEPLNSVSQTHFSNYVKIETEKLQFQHHKIQYIYVRLSKLE